MSYREQKDYQDRIERRLTLRYGRKPHERNLDKACSESVLFDGLDTEKSEAGDSEATTGCGLSVLASNALKPQADRAFTQKTSYYNNRQHKKNRELIAKRQKA